MKREMLLSYPRPTSLSDPFHDHDPGFLRDLIATPDEKLRWEHYQALLGPWLPAGTFEESAYFLPEAFEYMLANEENAFDVITSVVWFVSEYAGQLRRDGALPEVRSRLAACLAAWTASFEVVHWD